MELSNGMKFLISLLGAVLVVLFIEYIISLVVTHKKQIKEALELLLEAVFFTIIAIALAIVFYYWWTGNLP